MKKSCFIFLIVSLSISILFNFIFPIVWIFNSPFQTRQFFHLQESRHSIDDYKEGNLSAIANYLMFEDSNNTELSARMISRYDYISADYTYYYSYDYRNTSYETVVLKIQYDDWNYDNIHTELISKKGYSTDVSFSEKSYIFNLNDTAGSLIDYYYDTTNGYWVIKWINLVGFSEDDNTIVFLGWRIGINDNVVFKYSDNRWNYFYSWNSLIKMYFEEL